MVSMKEDEENRQEVRETAESHDEDLSGFKKGDRHVCT